MHRPEEVQPSRRPRGGFTLVEVLVSMTVLLLFVGMAANVLSVQGRVVTREARRQVALHGARAVTQTIERELRVAGTNLAFGQPVIVEGGPRSIVFNTDLVSPLEGDPFAAYSNPDADTLSVSVWRNVRALPLPVTGRSYPESTYTEAAGVPGAAETIAFWATRDSTSPRSDEYIIYRRVNAGAPEILARGIVVGAADTIFRYFSIDTIGRLRQFPTPSLPIYHRAAMHAAPSDTGPSARADSVKVVTITLKARASDPRGTPSIRTSIATVRIQNAAMAGRATCGETPFGSTPTAALVVAGGTSTVRIQWSAAIDDGGGEKDVQRYIIYRRAAGAAAFDNPLASIPAGKATYTFIDSDVVSGQQWQYGVSAQDCTPAMSSIGTTSSVTIP